MESQEFTSGSLRGSSCYQAKQRRRRPDLAEHLTDRIQGVHEIGQDEGRWHWQFHQACGLGRAGKVTASQERADVGFPRD